MVAFAQKESQGAVVKLPQMEAFATGLRVARSDGEWWHLLKRLQPPPGTFCANGGVPSKGTLSAYGSESGNGGICTIASRRAKGDVCANGGIAARTLLSPARLPEQQPSRAGVDRARYPRISPHPDRHPQDQSTRPVTHPMRAFTDPGHLPVCTSSSAALP